MSFTYQSINHVCSRFTVPSLSFSVHGRSYRTIPLGGLSGGGNSTQLKYKRIKPVSTTTKHNTTPSISSPIKYNNDHLTHLMSLYRSDTPPYTHSTHYTHSNESAAVLPLLKPLRRCLATNNDYHTVFLIRYHIHIDSHNQYTIIPDVKRNVTIKLAIHILANKQLLYHAVTNRLIHDFYATTVKQPIHIDYDVLLNQTIIQLQSLCLYNIYKAINAQQYYGHYHHIVSNGQDQIVIINPSIQDMIDNNNNIHYILIASDSPNIELLSNQLQPYSHITILPSLFTSMQLYNTINQSPDIMNSSIPQSEYRMVEPQFTDGVSHIVFKQCGISLNLYYDMQRLLGFTGDGISHLQPNIDYANTLSHINTKHKSTDIERIKKSTTNKRVAWYIKTKHVPVSHNTRDNVDNDDIDKMH